jgi:acyl carrier protein
MYLIEAVGGSVSMQDEHLERLVGCFEKVFPNLSRSDISAADHGSIAAWDSLAHVTLLSLVGEEFGIDIDFEEFEGATSFAAILDLVRAKTVNV